jgi:urea transport system permease protein
MSTLFVGAASAQDSAPGSTIEDPLAALVQQLPEGGYSERRAIIAAIAATGDTRAIRVLESLAERELYVNEETGGVFIGRDEGSNLVLIDPLTGDEIATVPEAGYDDVRVNNAVRRTISEAIGQLTLMSPERAIRLSAAQGMLQTANADSLGLLDEALAAETDPEVLAAMLQARAVLVLNSDADVDTKREAVNMITAMGNRNALAILTTIRAAAPEELQDEIALGIAGIERDLAAWQIGQNVWYGISLGSVLLLAAIGLAITFGVMGVINMAHGEMVMLGAYTTFVVQDAIRTSAPELFGYSLAIALPLAFLFTALVGILIERGIIRWLYGRPLETLLATWGLSLVIQQSVRSIFGPTNRQVGNPDWMSGAFELGGLSITWSRLWIVVFALVVFAVLLAVLNRTPLGLQMRAVTQNRRMASSMGIRTPWVDALTFGLGSGIAGLAGVALSQIDNVSPNLGQSYIIDSFMVVVFGGVGNLWGTLVGALTLGVVNKFLEPYAGAVLAKILILVFIILFIQRRPRGLFALKGRAVEQ